MNTNKTEKVFLTGGTAGIGRATALLLIENGYDVFIIGRDENKFKDLMDSYEALENSPGNLEGKLVDVTDEQALKNLWNDYVQQYGCPDILINNVGIPYQSVTENEEVSMEYLVKTNLWSYMWLSGQAGKSMMEHKIEGDIINVGSMSASAREEGSSAYVATKAGIQGFSESFRKEMNPHNIRVSLVEPGSVGTDMQPTTPAEEHELQQKMEMLKAEDIAKTLLFILKQPKRVNIAEVTVKPLRQFI
ncbi:SDR family oxidoreductase [Sphingobacterium kitahiroshimense]|uniref:SDR family oxidoreductase n=1 Tax=Sphingobacterium kitahiroshimense TaxID=470446 RepID=A0ABV0BXU2_9SPHI